MTEIKMGLTIEEAAECTGIGRNTMRKLVDWGKLPVLKVGRKTIIRRDCKPFELFFYLHSTFPPVLSYISVQFVSVQVVKLLTLNP